MHSIAKNAALTVFFCLFKFPRMQDWHFFQPKEGGPKWSAWGVWTKKKVSLFRRIFTPTFQQKKSHVTVRSVVRDLAYLIFLPAKVQKGRGLMKISGAPKKTVILAKKVGFFDIVKPL